LSPASDIVFYYRDGCHLCEEMAAVLYADWPRVFAAMRWVEVDGDLALRQRYGEWVPVLSRDGTDICRYRLQPEAMQSGFGDLANPL